MGANKVRRTSDLHQPCNGRNDNGALTLKDDSPPADPLTQVACDSLRRCAARLTERGLTPVSFVFVVFGADAGDIAPAIEGGRINLPLRGTFRQVLLPELGPAQAAFLERAAVLLARASETSPSVIEHIATPASSSLH